MTGWYAERTPDRQAKAVIAVTLLALLLVAAVPVALLAGVVMMMLGHVVGGLALFGGSILAAAMAVALAGMSGMRHLRKLLSGRSFRVVQLDGSQYTGVAEPVAEPGGSGYANVVQLDRSQYTEVR
jgi:predicted lipid-binding transport protein (Tim44 family)